MRFGVRDVGSEGLSESTLIDNTMTGCKLSVCEYTCNIRSYLKQLCKMEAKQEPVTTKINKRYEVEERKVREAHKGAMERRNELFKLIESHSTVESYARVKQVPRLDCKVSS
ncbi:DNA-directed RNA polymerase subunit alpha [Striga asiatica]|uniref:DNA-directed RNA polymerase subunit alpha n=1 Tax=Striga asiatica TaxID=4170 RepID=A0A5A7RA22_STRAF|nr:DNA-directed RNA polymerase subunit alpha [Striga asiatica]